MQLKSRLEIFTLLVILITVGIFSAVFLMNQAQSQAQLKASISDKQNVIEKMVVTDVVGKMERATFSFTRDEKLLKAIRQGDLEGIASRAKTTANLLIATGVVSNIRVLDPSKNILFTKNDSETGQYPLHLADKAIQEMTLVRGKEKVGNEMPEVHFVFPIAPRGKVLAIIDLSLEYGKLVQKEVHLSGDDLIVFDTNGAVISYSNEKYVEGVKALGIDFSETKLSEYSSEDAIYSLLNQPVMGLDGKVIAYKVSLTDSTELKSAASNAFDLGVILVFVWVVIAVLVIRYILGKALQPLNAMKEAVEKIEQTGHLSTQIPVHSNDEIGQATEAMNRFIAMVSQSISEVNGAMGAVASGDFTQRISGQYAGEFETLKQATNRSISSIDHTMRELTTVVNGLAAGDLSTRMNEKVPGDIRNSIDHTMRTMEAFMEDVSGVLAAMEKGDFTKQVTVEAKGSFKLLADHINARVHQTGKALDDISSVVSALAKGDMTRKVANKYEGKFGEVAALLSQSTQNLSQLISETNQGVLNLMDNVNQIHHGSQDLNDRTQRQAASLEETSATMHAITQGVDQTRDSAQTANQLSVSARTQADKGAVIMRSTIDSMGNIKEASHKIEEIISLIDSIAFQTNLLALNAAVEAARAGEHGRGFAVVAGEVRNLAGKSADAARDIKGLIENAVAAVDQGTERAEQSDQALQGIIESIRKVGDIVAEITAGANEQATSINQIGQAVSDLDQVTQQNAALVEETSAAAENMRDDADSLTRLVGTFKV